MIREGKTSETCSDGCTIKEINCLATYVFAKVWFWLAVVAGVLVLLLGVSNVRAAFSQARLVRLWEMPGNERAVQGIGDKVTLLKGTH